MTLRGPADADTFRVKKGNARRYLDHLAPCELRPEPMTDSVVAMSTIKGAEGKGGLVGWTGKAVANAAVDELDTWQRMEHDAAVDYLAAAGDRARDKAANRGTNVHDYIERLLDGRGVSVWDGAGSEYRPAIEAFVAEWRPVVKYAEVVAFGNVDGDEWAGTLDAIVNLPRLGTVMVDWKSRAATAANPHTVHAGEVCQLGGYSSADYIIVEENGVARRAAMPKLDGLALVTFTPDAYEVHPIDLDGAAETFRRLHGWWRGMQLARKVVGRKANPNGPGLAEHTVAELKAIAEAEGIEFPKAARKGALIERIEAARSDDSDPTPPHGIERPDVVIVDEAAELDTLKADLADRITALIETGAEIAVRHRWPDGIGRVSGIDNMPDALTMRAALDRAEADVGAPFTDYAARVTDRFAANSPETIAAEIQRAKVDEGPDVGADDVETVRTAWHFLEPDGSAWLTDLATRAGNLSLTEQQTARRARIGWALVRLAAAGWHDDELLAACIEHAEISSNAVDDPAPILAGLSAGNAKRLSDVVTDLVEDRLTFTVGDTAGGPMRLTAAQTPSRSR